MSRPKPRKNRSDVPQSEGREQAQEPPRKRRFGWFTHEWVTAWATVILAIFAIAAWIESTRGTRAMQGQLEIMQAQQEPTIDISNAQPTFDQTDGRIRWIVYFQNVGKGAAYDFKMETFMKTAVQFDYVAGDAGYRDLDTHEGSTFIAGQHVFVTLISQQTFADQESAHKALVSGDVAALLHFRFKVTENGRIKDQWFCSGKRGELDIFDIPPRICIDLLPTYVPRPKYGGTAKQANPTEQG